MPAYQKGIARAQQGLNTLTLSDLVDAEWAYEGRSGIDLMNLLVSFPLNTYLFRGQPDERWSLQPSLERLPELAIDRNTAESLVLRAFVRRAHHYIQDLPKPDNTLEWLALMRHHGAPTRLLDWTASPYVAAFFAVAEAQEDAVPVIWAVHPATLLADALRQLHEAYPDELAFNNLDSDAYPQCDDLFGHLLRLKEPAVVVPVRPFRFNDRLARQQGWFICGNSPNMTFESALTRVIQRVPKTLSTVPPLIRIVLRPGQHAATLLELAKMNITYETLFPGLDGFARALETHLKIRTIATTSHAEGWL